MRWKKRAGETCSQLPGAERMAAASQKSQITASSSRPIAFTAFRKCTLRSWTSFGLLFTSRSAPKMSSEAANPHLNPLPGQGEADAKAPGEGRFANVSTIASDRSEMEPASESERESFLTASCPLPITNYKQIVLAHGSGG